MSVFIRSRLKYRIPGSWPKAQTSPGTPNSGDAYLYKHRTKTKMGAKTPAEAAAKTAHQERSRANMRALHILPGGRKRWV